jgi:hypothetical protein
MIRLIKKIVINNMVITNFSLNKGCILLIVKFIKYRKVGENDKHTKFSYLLIGIKR